MRVIIDSHLHVFVYHQNESQSFQQFKKYLIWMQLIEKEEFHFSLDIDYFLLHTVQF